MSEMIIKEQATLFQSVLGELGIALTVDIERFDSVVDMVEDSMRRFADREAFTSLGHSLSFADVDRLSGQFASWLQHHTDLEVGDRVAQQFFQYLL